MQTPRDGGMNSIDPRTLADARTNSTPIGNPKWKFKLADHARPGTHQTISGLCFRLVMHFSTDHPGSPREVPCMPSVR